MANTLSVYTMYGGQATQATQTRPLSSYGMMQRHDHRSMREVTGRALSLNARPLHALLATSTCTARVHAPLKHVAAFDSSPHLP